MKHNPRLLVISAVGWAGFVGVVLWTTAFLAAVIVPRTVDGPARTGTVSAVLWDAGLLALFAVQHSVMARSRVKSAMRRGIPIALERALYVVATDVCLALILTLWQPFGGSVWDLHGVAAGLVWGLYLAGWLLAVGSTFAVDHLELTGLRQAGWAPPVVREIRLRSDGLYGLVRHPLMSGLLVALWATPRMSASHPALRRARHGIRPRRHPVRGARPAPHLRPEVRRECRARPRPAPHPPSAVTAGDLRDQVKGKTMPRFLIERTIPRASELTREELAAITARSNAAVASLSVPYRWVTSYVAGDKFYCVHETEQLDTVLAHAQAGGFPVDAVTEAATQIDPDYS